MATRILSRIRPPASNSDAMSSGVFSLPPCCAHSPSNPPPLQSDSSRTASAQTVSTPRGIRLAKSSRSKENTHQSVNRPTCSSACCMSASSTTILLSTPRRRHHFLPSSDCHHSRGPHACHRNHHFPYGQLLPSCLLLARRFHTRVDRPTSQH